MTTADLTIGQAVSVKKCDSPASELSGFVRRIDNDNWIAVEFEAHRSSFHQCDGSVKSGKGYFVQLENLEPKTSALPTIPLLPIDPAARKLIPFVTGLLDYFPSALVEVAKVSYVGNQQHNPGQPLHWSRGKSADYADTIGRHLLERGGIDTDGMRHSAKLAWRALALLQVELEAEGAPLARGAKLPEEKK